MPGTGARDRSPGPEHCSCSAERQTAAAYFFSDPQHQTNSTSTGTAEATLASGCGHKDPEQSVSCSQWASEPVLPVSQLARINSCGAVVGIVKKKVCDLGLRVDFLWRSLSS
ncbi:unnamed protein product [Pleuronectes platessa]|uniref:Uncharacterized protein n=1 Tax=Pleuronectes platessa TaxID=8262 RepID=A0A9N7UDP4_PLEPL|nr:unnamed protein product [Pleuronectes platessa]